MKITTRQTLLSHWCGNSPSARFLPQTSVTSPVSYTALKYFLSLVQIPGWDDATFPLFPLLHSKATASSHTWASPASSHTWSSWQCEWLAPGSRGPHSGVEGSHRLGTDTSKSLSCPHPSAHMVAMVTTGRSPHPESHFAPVDTHQEQDPVTQGRGREDTRS